MCDFRQNREHWEWSSLAPFAAHSTDPALDRRRSLGEKYGAKLRSSPDYSPWPRDQREEDGDDDLPGTKSRYKTAFQIDKERITKSTAFRRLEYKTQVFISHEGDHYRTRLTHTIEVCETARLIAQALQLNEDLVEAIALGHDLGHTPIGHVGEEKLNELFNSRMKRYEKLNGEGRKVGGAFYHNVQGVRVVDTLEKGYEWDRRESLGEKGFVEEYDPESPPDKKGYGMDLCWAVREGILKHTDRGLRHEDTIMYGSEYLLEDLDYRKPASLEGQVVEFADEIASMMHDIEDGIRSRGFSIAHFRAALVGEMKKLRIEGSRRVLDSKESFVLDDLKGLKEAFGLSSDFFHFEDADSDRRKLSRLTKMSRIAAEILDLEKECTVGHIIGFLRTLFISNLIEASYTRLMEAMIGGHDPASFPGGKEYGIPREGDRLLVIFCAHPEMVNGDRLPFQAWEEKDESVLVPRAWLVHGDGSREEIDLEGRLRLFWISRSTDQSKRSLITITDEARERGYTFPLERVCIILEAKKLIGYSKGVADLSRWLRKEFIRDNLHRAPVVIRNGEKGRLWMRKLFRRYLEAPLCLPRSTLPKYAIKVSKEKGDSCYMTGLPPDRHPVQWDLKCVLRVIEHLQGMTDRYLGEEYARFFLDENRMSENEEISIIDTDAGPFLLVDKRS